MSLLEQLTNDMKTAMKSGEKMRLSTIRLLRGQIKDAAINKQAELTKDEEIAVITHAAKRRKESIQAYTDAGRDDLVEKEKSELVIIQAYLPEQLSIAEVEKMVDDAIEQVGAQTISDLGKVMPVVMAKAKGRADGKQINQLVRKKLG